MTRISRSSLAPLGRHPARGGLGALLIAMSASLGGCATSDVVVTPTVMRVASSPGPVGWMGALLCGALAVTFAGIAAYLLVWAVKTRETRDLVGIAALTIPLGVFAMAARACLATQELVIHRDARQFEQVRRIAGWETARRSFPYADVRKITFPVSGGYAQIVLVLNDGSVRESPDTLERPALMQIERALRDDLGRGVVP